MPYFRCMKRIAISFVLTAVFNCLVKISFDDFVYVRYFAVFCPIFSQRCELFYSLLSTMCSHFNCKDLSFLLYAFTLPWLAISYDIAFYGFAPFLFLVFFRLVWKGVYTVVNFLWFIYTLADLRVLYALWAYTVTTDRNKRTKATLVLPFLLVTVLKWSWYIYILKKLVLKIKSPHNVLERRQIRGARRSPMLTSIPTSCWDFGNRYRSVLDWFFITLNVE